MANLTDDEIKGLLVREIRSARSNDDSELAASRREALEYFNGVMKDVPAEVGRSSVVSRDLADTVGWMLPSIMRVFCASDRMVVAEPVGEEDDDMADNATDGLNYVFWKDNPGYRILRDATWDALVLKNAILKVYHDDTPKYATTFHSGLTDDDLALIEADEDAEITHQTTTTEMQVVLDPATGRPVEMPVNVHEVKVKRLKSRGRRVIECIPPEDYLQDSAAITTEAARFKAHRSEKTRSELIEMGFDRKTVESLGTAKEDEADEQARDDHYEDDKDAAEKSMQLIELYECYLKVDCDDDGIAETIRAYYAGNKDGGNLLDWEVWEDEGPFFDIPCDPVPHRWDAKSIADETMDMQRVKTVLWRQGLDNTYATNNPQRFVKGKLLNPDELFSPSFGGAVFGDANSSVENLAVPFVANHAYEALTYADEVIQRRTGVGRQSMALDPDALQNQTATANQNNKDAAYSQVELVARDMAELGWKPFFRALLQLEIRHQDKPRQVRMGKKSVTIDPRSWNADMDITINVGLGTGSRDRDMMMLQQVLGSQLSLADRFMATGATEQAIDMLPKVINTMTKIAESAGLRNPDAFYPEDTDAIVAELKKLAAQPKPNPVVEAERAKLEAKIEETRIQSEAAVVKEKAQLEADALTNEQTQAFERYKLDREYAFKEKELRQQRDLELMKLGAQQQTVGEDGETVSQPSFDGTAVMLAQLMDRFEALQMTITAPKRVVRDANGRAVGVETVTN